MSKCEQCAIRQFNSLKSLTKDELIRVAGCKTSKTIKKGTVLFEEGEHINGVFCVKKGICKISKMSDNGRDQIVNLIQKGDLLGERSLINDEASNLKAIAINDMEICFIPKEEIVRDLEENQKFTMDILKTMASSLKTADDFIVDMAQKTVKQRLASTLLNLDCKFTKNENGALDIQLSREDIANIIGTATESAIRLLSEFKKKKLIDLKGKQVFILDKQALKDISTGF
ncbi:Crp/Fnr family transcriptional regulator [Tenacibaculum finnmarkense genomovar finnmarkense]|uniref:Crp/Fnr family transcriptional regulator n=1 Tax=Tenacibaculum finnmarkense TaxID=2781243 RepID=UPI001E4AA41A|nr:Crp/Fnr family transcriptional regulator [Tenacibaculum finnmarkense]MCD8418006.1 Crp/Fnr family transcriptional regulator [Tenacibaculum finnmarkense genomovar finnmarkense]MCG8186393.1 Crp/Fnr family transcriptional regulator [Tenacibaculum finnmarkense genomovar finnmarkense]MCG8202876.1 Crp/Fnr family transcriptional regulator [Tenacibaculum finnmarkense genomovar finnmarkense]MCG8210194.1 Crp/Fnr family transcriptional regulator [Tenacibaculum finnmarkense genomovar finnmarkense]MCG821